MHEQAGPHRAKLLENGIVPDPIDDKFLQRCEPCGLTFKKPNYLATHERSVADLVKTGQPITPNPDRVRENKKRARTRELQKYRCDLFDQNCQDKHHLAIHEKTQKHQRKVRKHAFLYPEQKTD